LSRRPRVSSDGPLPIDGRGGREFHPCGSRTSGSDSLCREVPEEPVSDQTPIKNVMSVIEEFEVEIPSDTAAGQEVQARILKMLEDHNFPPRDVFGVRLALEEALVNAIKHGNRMDVNKVVRVGCQVFNEKVRVEIEDQGEGFRPEDVPDPTADENLERPCGRGIMLMRSFMSLIEYNETGNCVILEKERNSEPDD
jgi:serine/threonine-protein kinase RsbW